MTSLQLLRKLLKSQKPGKGKPNDWTRIVFVEENRGSEGIDILVKSQSIGFSFDQAGNFKGIYNWQE